MGKRSRLGDGNSIETRTLIWTAGVRAGELAELLESERGRGGRIVIKPTLQHLNHPEVYVIGDDATGR